jgi:hypothetical protein
MHIRFSFLMSRLALSQSIAKAFRMLYAYVCICLAKNIDDLFLMTFLWFLALVLVSVL